jgi:hypothetical protein
MRNLKLYLATNSIVFMTEYLKNLIKTARNLEEALAKYGQSVESSTELRSEDMMKVAIRLGVYPVKPKWGFKLANWNNGAPVRKLVSELDKQGVQPKTLISCEFKKALNKDSHSNPLFRTDQHKYYFYPKQAAKKMAEKLNPEKKVHEAKFVDTSVEQSTKITTSSKFSDAMKLVANLTTKMDHFITTPSDNGADEIETIVQQISEFVKAEISNQTKA